MHAEHFMRTRRFLFRLHNNVREYCSRFVTMKFPLAISWKRYRLLCRRRARNANDIFEIISFVLAPFDLTWAFLNPFFANEFEDECMFGWPEYVLGKPKIFLNMHRTRKREKQVRLTGRIPQRGNIPRIRGIDKNLFVFHSDKRI